ncbi:PepSY domain-containing protein [Peptoniphilus stercorisuis]|uniref:Membrane protein YkoI n=1 Tax=Peptoniphilus stercorisuis TaxID=1436965 RepID=A0ABS4KAK9_9FIRM|nr:PepSY domain-containing protein [Peptoniphilus stercorisuis]MBP2024815.1 putative membrane protein YkoI [Peptoniphilus stercorisuis]
MKKKLILILGLSFVLTACGNKNVANKTDNNQNIGNKIENAVNIDNDNTKDIQELRMANGKNIAYEDITIKAEEAARIFKNDKPNVNLKDISLEIEANSYVYKLSGVTETEEYEIEINPVTGDIIKTETEKDRDLVEGFEINDDHLAKIDPIIEKALADAGEEYSFYEWDIEVDDGRIELNVELRDKSGKDIEYKYNVENEELIEKER